MDPSHDGFNFSTALKKRPLSASLAGRKPQAVRNIQFREADGLPVEAESGSSSCSRQVLQRGPTGLRSSFYGNLPPPQVGRTQHHDDPSVYARRSQEPLIKRHRLSTSLQEGPFSQAQPQQEQSSRDSVLQRSSADGRGFNKHSTTTSSLPSHTSSTHSRLMPTVDELIRDAEDRSAGATGFMRSHIFRAAAMAIRLSASPERSRSPVRDVAALLGAARGKLAAAPRGAPEADNVDEEAITRRYFSSTSSRTEGPMPLVGLGLRALLIAFERGGGGGCEGNASSNEDQSYAVPNFVAARPKQQQQQPQPTMAVASPRVSGIGMLHSVLTADVEEHYQLQRRRRDEFIARQAARSANSSSLALEMLHQQSQKGHRTILQGRLATNSSGSKLQRHGHHGLTYRDLSVAGTSVSDAVVDSAMKMAAAKRPVSASFVRPMAHGTVAAAAVPSSSSRPTSAASQRQSQPPAATASASGSAAAAAGAIRQGGRVRPQSAPVRRPQDCEVSTTTTPGAGGGGLWLEEYGLIGVSLDPARSPSPSRSVDHPPPAMTLDETPSPSVSGEAQGSTPSRKLQGGVVRGGAGFFMMSKRIINS